MLPVAALYLPAAQAVQGPPFGPVVPASQVQSSRLPLPAGELDATGHDVQKFEAFAPIFVLKVPGGHRTQRAAP